MGNIEKNIENKLKDPYEIAKESHMEDVKRWEEKIEKFNLVILRAKGKILENLKEKAKKYKEDLPLNDENKPIPISREGIKDKTGEEGKKRLIELAPEATALDIKIIENDWVRIGDTNFSHIINYKTLTKNEKRVLQAVSLFHFLKNLPLQLKEENFEGKDLDLKIRRNKEERQRWMVRRETLEDILKEFENVNISKTGYMTPSYIKGVPVEQAE